MKRKLLLAALCVVGALGFKAQAQQTPVADGIYYVYNQLTGKFMSRGADWGTRAIVDDYGVPVKLEATGDNFYMKCTDNELYMSDDAWMYTDGGTDRYRAYAITAADGAPGAYTLTNTNNNLFVYVYLGDGTDKYCMAGNGTKGDNYTDDGQVQWVFLTQAEHDALIAQKQLDGYKAIAAAAGYTASSVEEAYAIFNTNFETVDVTSTYLGDDNLNNGGAGDWTVNGVRKLDESWATYVGGGNGVAESFSAATSLTKELKGLRQGIYKVSMNGFFRQGNNAVCWANKEAGFLPSNAYLKAGDYSVALKAWAVASTKDGDIYTPDNTTQAAAAFNNGDYVNEVYTYVGEDGNLTLTVGIPNFINWAGWACYNNVQMTYYRDKSADAVSATGISLDQTSVELTTGSTATLTATVTPENADDPSVTWTSSDESVATVKNGVITALKAGTATITASANGGENITATATVTVEDAMAPSFYSSAIEDGVDYYIVNAATGKFLGGANSWGTQASLIEHGIPFTAVVLENGKYKLDSHTYNSATAHFFNGTYVDNGDADPTQIYIVSLGDGKFSISNSENSQFVTAAVGSTVLTNTATDANSSMAQWYFLSKTDRDKMLATATAENPVDATYYIGDANFSRNHILKTLKNGTNVDNPANETYPWTYTVTNYNFKGGNNENMCAESYHSAGTVSQALNVPNGTYLVKCQGFRRVDSGSEESYLFANNEKVPLAVFNGNGEGTNANMSGASTSFSAGKYVNYLTVEVTDRTLTIGIQGAANNWTIWDNFELYMTKYIPVIGITASIDNAEIEAGETATITAATDPASASFNAVTFTSSDEAIATVDANGVVTGAGIGTATITVTANEMENFSTTVDVTVTAVTPTALDLSEEEVSLDVENPSATLTVIPTPEGANTSVTWTSSDETVATVANGVVTGISSGTATITATSTINTDIYATATVTVTFPETATAAEDEVISGPAISIVTYGENQIKNGTFEYPDGFSGWTDATASAAKLTSANFEIVTEGDSKYLRSKNHGGSTAASSIGTAWTIEPGKTYVFGYKAKAVNAGTTEFHKVSLTNTLSTESKVISETKTVNTDWTDIKYKFTNTDNYTYLQFRARWLGEKGQLSSFDDFYLVEVTGETSVGNVDYATAAIPTANVGTGAFQYSQDAINAANALVQGEATVEEVEAAYEAVTTINAPADGQLFNVILTYSGWTYDQKAMTYIANGRTDGGNYNIQYKEAANQNLAQAFTFTKVSGNNYKMSQIDADGNARYLSTGVPYSGTTAQIRTTTNAEEALVVTLIPTATEGVYNLRNTEANNYIGSQDAGVYTVNSHINFNIVETTKPSIEINTTEAGYGTIMLPFAAEIPSGVTVYSCAAVDGNTLTLNPVDAIEANKPYIIEGDWNETLTGDAQGTALTYTADYLTGVYESTEVPVGSYVLQNQEEEDGVAFYLVDEDPTATTENASNFYIKPNRAYLTVPAGANVRALFFPESGDATGINGLEVLTSGSYDAIYTAGGAKVNSLQKGLNIVVKDGKSYKIFVK